MDTRQKLIKIGAMLFADKSFSEVSVETVTKKAKVSKGAFYHYFVSKEDFYFQIINEAYKIFQNIFLENEKKMPSDIPRIRIFIESALTFFQREKNLYMVIQNEVNKIVAGKKTHFYEFQQKTIATINSLIANKSDAMLPYVIMGLIRSAVVYKVQQDVDENEIFGKLWKYINACLEAK